MRTKIVSDSSVNIQSVTDKEVSFVPLRIYVDGKEFIDDPNLNTGEMLRMLRESKTKSSTSCPGTEEWIEAFDNADIVYGVSITSKLSGCYNSSRLAVEAYKERKPDAKVFILDSLTTGPEMVLILEKYREMIDQDLSFEEVVSGIQNYMKHTHLLFELSSLDNLARNGRVSHIVAKAAGILGIRVIGRASNEGTLEVLHKCRGEKKALKQMITSMHEAGCHGGKIRITHSNNPESAAHFAEMVRTEWPKADITVAPNGGLCCYYAEEGSLMVGFES